MELSDNMDKQTKVLVAILAIFVIGMTMSVAFADPVSATKYKGKMVKKL